MSILKGNNKKYDRGIVYFYVGARILTLIIWLVLIFLFFGWSQGWRMALVLIAFGFYLNITNDMIKYKHKFRNMYEEDIC